MVAYRVTTNYSDKPGGLMNTPEGGVFELQESHAKTTKTNDDIASSVVGLGSDQEKIADKVKATCANVAQLKKDFEEFCRRAEARPKCPRKRSRSRGRGGCHCAIVQYNDRTDRRLKRGDEVFLRARHGGEPTLKRYFVGMNGRGFSQLSNDRAGQVRHGRVSNHDLFIKMESWQSCRRGR